MDEEKKERAAELLLQLSAVVAPARNKGMLQAAVRTNAGRIRVLSNILAVIRRGQRKVINVWVQVCLLHLVMVQWLSGG